MYIIPSDTTWTCTEGAKGRVVGPDIDVEGEIIETAERPLRFAPT